MSTTAETHYYAGIGSRRTPPDVLELMRSVAAHLKEQGWILRSGHAPGADQAFELGAAQDAQVFLPWLSFEHKVPVAAREVFYWPTHDAYNLAAEHHPHWARLSGGARSLHSRNSHQILGWELQSPVEFVICWTPNGSRDGKEPDTGGTGQALRIAAAYGVRVYNLQRSAHRLIWDQIVHPFVRSEQPLTELHGR